MLPNTNALLMHNCCRVLMPGLLDTHCLEIRLSRGTAEKVGMAEKVALHPLDLRWLILNLKKV